MILAQQLTTEAALWLLGITVVPVIGWCVHLTIMVMTTRQSINELLHMHRHADDFGFGTVALTRLIETQDRSLKALVHYVKWFVEKQTGETPPPPLDEKL